MLCIAAIWKFFVHNGIKVTKIHQTVKFHQSKWLSKYIQLNTQKRQEASSKFDQDFYKLISNSTFGKLCESLRNRVTVSFVRTEEELLKTISDGNISSTKIIDEGLSLISKKKQSILWNKLTIVGASFLELSKLFMLDFHYNVIKKTTQSQLLYSDTDSFVYKLKTGDFYQDLEINSTLRAHFDFSNFPGDHKLFDRIQGRASRNPHWRVLCFTTKIVFNSCRWAEQNVCQRNKKICPVEAQPWNV